VNDQTFIPQGSPAWIKQRLGCATGSRMFDLTAKTKTGYAASRAAYVRELAYERLTGRAVERFVTREMQWGVDNEPAAKTAYALVTGCDVAPAPFVPHPAVPMSGASPDGFVSHAGLIEIKCLTSFNAMDILIEDKIPEKYLPQCHWAMACTGRLWCDFVSFDPRLPPGMQIWIKRVERDDDMIAKLVLEVLGFLEEVDKTVDFLLAKYPSP